MGQNVQCGESVTIDGRTYTVSSVTHRYQLRKGKYEPSEKRLDVLSTGRYILNLYLENLLEQSWFFYLLHHNGWLGLLLNVYRKLLFSFTVVVCWILLWINRVQIYDALIYSLLLIVNLVSFMFHPSIGLEEKGNK